MTMAMLIIIMMVMMIIMVITLFVFEYIIVNLLYFLMINTNQTSNTMHFIHVKQ